MVWVADISLDGGGDGMKISFGSGAGDRVEDSCGHERSVEEAWVWVCHCRLKCVVVERMGM